jgi:hypothetical protein
MPLPDPLTLILTAAIASAFWTFVCWANGGNHVR